MAYEYGAKEPEKLKIKDMTDRQKELLIDSETFCMLPWLHLHAFPDGRAYPCCFALDKHHVGWLGKDTMKDVFNGEQMKKMRLNMLDNKPCKECVKCYDQEKSGFFSMRMSANKHFGHNIGLIENTQPDGQADFMIKYWDIRFSNLCNMACRSCGTWFSSNWYEDHKKLHGEPPRHAKIIRAGRYENDIWEQMLEHFDYVEQFYFAGGEPMIMEEHYRILKELDRRKMYHVKLIYNTNFSRLKFKDLDVLELWKKFDSVSVGASLDASGGRAEFMRKGTKWHETIANRKRMLEVCPHVDFYISATVGLINAIHVADFHKEWCDLGYIKPADFNFNLLQFPHWQRIDLAPSWFKDRITQKYQTHLEWLRPLDPLTRATKGFESALDYMMRRDNSKDLDQFKDGMAKIDKIRNEDILMTFPELKDLYEKD